MIKTVKFKDDIEAVAKLKSQEHSDVGFAS